MSESTKRSYRAALPAVVTPTATVPINGSNLPRRYSRSRFVGRRKEIQKIMDTLASDDWILTIDSMGGVGKTTLALEVAHRCKEGCTGNPYIPPFTGYIWTSAERRRDFCLDRVIKVILDVLCPFETRTRPLAPSEKLTLAVSLLAAEPRLLIIDCLDAVRGEPLDGVLRFLRNQFPEPSKVLITTRHHVDIGTGERRVKLRGLEPEDAVWFLELEAERLEISLGERGQAVLEIIAQKSFGIPWVLQWVMQRVYDGMTYECVLESLEDATEERVFVHIFDRSLSLLHPGARSVFRSMSLLPVGSTIETIAALNPGIEAIQDHVSRLVSLSLTEEDNRYFDQDTRRYRLHELAQKLASRERAGTADGGRGAVEGALAHYLGVVRGLEPRSEWANAYLEAEGANISHVVGTASSFADPFLLEQCVQLAEGVSHLSYQEGRDLFDQLTRPIVKTGDESLALSLLDSMGSPYVAWRPVRSSMFFGRRPLLKFIRERLETDYMHTSVISLVGLRRIGKTSVLLQLGHQRSSRCIYVFVDLQGVVPRDSARLLYYIARAVWRETAGSKFAAAEPSDEEFAEQPYRAFDAYIEDVLSVLGTRRLVLMLDEFDVLFDAGDQDRTDTESLVAYLRARVQAGAFGVITSGVTPLDELPSSVAVHPFFSLAVSKRVSFLDQEAARQLIQQPTCGLIQYDEQSIEHLVALSGCHPNILQLMCDSIVDLCCERGRLRVNRDTVEAVMPFMFDQYFFHELMGQWGDDEQSALRTAASIVDAVQATFTIDRLREALSTHELQVSQLESSLGRLVRREFLAVDRRGNYNFTMEIFRRWLVERAA